MGCINDPFGVGEVEVADVPDDGRCDLRIEGQVDEDVFDASQVHGGLELGDTIEAVAHEDGDATFGADIVALPLDVGVVEPIGRGPAVVRIDILG